MPEGEGGGVGGCKGSWRRGEEGNVGSKQGGAAAPFMSEMQMSLQICVARKLFGLEQICMKRLDMWSVFIKCLYCIFAWSLVLIQTAMWAWQWEDFQRHGERVLHGFVFSVKALRGTLSGSETGLFSGSTAVISWLLFFLFTKTKITNKTMENAGLVFSPFSQRRQQCTGLLVLFAYLFHAIFILNRSCVQLSLRVSFLIIPF